MSSTLSRTVTLAANTGGKLAPTTALGSPLNTGGSKNFTLSKYSSGIVGTEPKTDENGEQYFIVGGKKYGAKIYYDPESDTYYYGPDLDNPLDGDTESSGTSENNQKTTGWRARY